MYICLVFLTSDLFYVFGYFLEFSDTEQRLLEINQRYELLSSRLKDRELELEGLVKDVGHFTAQLNELLAWIDQSESYLQPSKALPTDSEEISRKLKEYQVFSFYSIFHQSRIVFAF